MWVVEHFVVTLGEVWLILVVEVESLLRAALGPTTRGSLAILGLLV